MPIIDFAEHYYTPKNASGVIDMQQWLNLLLIDQLNQYIPDKKILLIPPFGHHEQIQQAIHEHKVDAVLVETCSHAFTVSVEFYHKYSVPVYFLSSNLEHFFSDSDCIIFFPIWLKVLQSFIKSYVKIGAHSDIYRQYKIVTTVRNLLHRKHRIYFYGKLLQTNYSDSVRKNFYKNQDFDFNFEDFNADLTYDEWLRFKEVYDQSPCFPTGEMDAILDINFDIYTQGYVHVVSETYPDYNFLSEKSLKPIFAGQIPLIIGGQNIMQMYKDLGFDLFNDIIDYKHFDNEPDYKIRVAKVLELLQNVKDLELDKIFKLTEKRRQQNIIDIMEPHFFARAGVKLKSLLR